MPETKEKYWNPLASPNSRRCEPVEGLEGVAEEVTLAIDAETGDYTRLTRFKPGADTSSFGSRKHDYPEEIMIIEGRLYDADFDRWLEAVDYASRPPGEVHGSFKTRAVVLFWRYHTLVSRWPMAMAHNKRFLSAAFVAYAPPLAAGFNRYTSRKNKAYSRAVAHYVGVRWLVHGRCKWRALA